MQGYRTATDDTLHESVRHGTSGYPFAYYRENIWQFDFHRIDWHWHHELEFLLSSESAVSCLVGTDRIELPGRMSWNAAKRTFFHASRSRFSV